jgi:invasion protein IalB
MGQPEKVNAASKEAANELKKFGNWSLSCSTDNQKKEFCFLTQQITNNTKEKEQEILAMYHVGYFGKEKELKIIQVLPTNVQIAAGTSIISGEKLIAAGKYASCTTANCQAVAIISPSDLKTILSSNNNSVASMNAEGKQINYPFSKDGLKEGLDALKK